MREAVMSITVGALSPPFAEQLSALPLSKAQRESLALLDLDAKAVSRLYVRGLINTSTANRARDKIAKAVWKEARDAS